MTPQPPRPFPTAIAVALATGMAIVAPAPAAGQATGQGTNPAADPGTAALRYVVTPQGNQARFLVREQLLGRDLPNDAVGVTSRITGSIALDASGAIIPADSRIAVDLSDLTSDSDRRDNYIKRRTLDTENHPLAVFVPRLAVGLDGPLPDDGAVSFRLVGDMTVRGVTRQIVWHATARRDGDAITGRASVRFPFDRFDLEIPRVRSVLSVDDDIRLEYDFRLLPATPE